MREYRNRPDREVNRDELLLLGCFHVLCVFGCECAVFHAALEPEPPSVMKNKQAKAQKKKKKITIKPEWQGVWLAVEKGGQEEAKRNC